MVAPRERWRVVVCWDQAAWKWVRIARTRVVNGVAQRWFLSRKVEVLLATDCVLMLESVGDWELTDDIYRFLDRPEDFEVGRWFGYEPEGFMATKVDWPSAVSEAWKELLRVKRASPALSELSA